MELPTGYEEWFYSTIQMIKNALEDHPMKRDLGELLDNLLPSGDEKIHFEFTKALSELQEEDNGSRFYVSQWRTNNEGYDHLKPGDLLEFSRANRRYPFCHWAVYIGPVRGPVTDRSSPVNFKHVVAHMHGKDDPEGSRANYYNKHGYPISFGLLDEEIEVSNEYEWRINNKVKDECTAYPRICVVFMAILAVFGIISGFEKYHLFETNCEHFARFCTEGRRESLQTKSGKMLMAFRNQILNLQLLVP